MKNINGYEMLCDFRNDNSGYSRWGFAEKDGIEVFIKEFLSPVYPVNTSILTPEMVAKNLAKCEKFVATKERFYNALNLCNTGNIIGITDFFRCNAKYYIITEKVDNSELTISDISAMPLKQKHLICKIITHCVNALHKNNIVHSDIKHDNIIFKKTPKGKYTAKLIDFDAGFLQNELPSPDDDFHGDQVYFAPESLLYMVGETDKINQKIDVFALGLLFHQYFTGKLPDFDQNEYSYAHEAVLDNVVLKSDKSIPDEYAKIIDSMLLLSPDERPTLDEVFKSFGDMELTNIKTGENPSKVSKLPLGFYKAGDL